MGKIKIEKPRVFISYAWGDEEYQQSILDFATALREDGIDVMLDKWDLKEGNDTYAFMERTVKDPSITNVLIMLDPLYAEKANKRAGGVGAETQIISPEIYNNTEQNKFIPIVFKRDFNGNIDKPFYLRSRLYFDLSNSSNYEVVYQKLVKRLYGVETYEKPELGKRPIWVDNPESAIAPIKKGIFYSIKNINEFKQELNNIKERTLSFNGDNKTAIEIYNELIEIRDEILELLKITLKIESSNKIFLETLQDISNAPEVNYWTSISIKSMIHEVFVYSIAFYFKEEQYKKLSYALNKTYFDKSNKPQGFPLFGTYNGKLDAEIKQRDNKNYYSGVAQNWIDHINISVCSKQDFIIGDLLCANYVIFCKSPLKDLQWFPLSYCYSDGTFGRIFSRLYTKEYLDKIKGVFGYEDTGEFVLKIKEIAEKIKSDYPEKYRKRYPAAFNGFSLIYDSINIDEIGKYH